MASGEAVATTILSRIGLGNDVDRR